MSVPVDFLKLGQAQKWNENQRIESRLKELCGVEVNKRRFNSPLDLSGMRLTDVIFHECELVSINLEGSELQRCTFSHCNMIKANLRNVQGENSKFEDSDLENAELDGAALPSSQFTRTPLKRVTAVRAVFDRSQFHSVALNDAQLQGASFRFANMNGATFDGASLESADLSRAILIAASFKDADLTCTKGLYGKLRARVDKVKDVDSATFGSRFDIATWQRIRTVGQLPLFGVSYLGIIGICLLLLSVKFSNLYLEKLRSLPDLPGLSWLRSLPEIPIPQSWGVTLIALVLLALAATIYKLTCHEELQENSETRWIFELSQPAIQYHSMSYSKIWFRWVCFVLYWVGGMWCFGILMMRVGDALSFAFT